MPQRARVRRLAPGRAQRALREPVRLVPQGQGLEPASVLGWVVRRQVRALERLVLVSAVRWLHPAPR